MKINKVILLFCTFFIYSVQQTEAQQRSLEQAMRVAESFMLQRHPDRIKAKLERAEGSLEQMTRGRNHEAKNKTPSRKPSPDIDEKLSRREPSFACRPIKEYHTDNVQPLFIFNAENGGFVIISGDERMQPVLGYSNHGCFESKDIPTALVRLLDYYAAEYEYVQRPEVVAIGANVDRTWPAVTPFGKSLWGQNSPFNNQCPVSAGQACATGCVATVMAQAMNIYQYPVRGQGNISYVTETLKRDVNFDFGSTTFDWENMIADYSQGYTETQGHAVATLMAACGAGVGMDYNTDESGASHINIPYSMINHFGYNSNVVNYERDYFTDEEWLQIMHEELENGRPLLYRGVDGDGGHIFLIDGCDEDNYFHVNWGWEGDYDGYYSIDALSPGQYKFTSYQAMVCHIFPELVGEHEDVFYAKDFYASDAAIQIGDSYTLYLTNVYNYSSWSTSVIEETTFTGLVGFGLFDENDNYICNLATRRDTLMHNWGWKSFRLQVNASSEIFNEDVLYHIRPIVQDDRSETPTPIRTSNAACYFITARVVDGYLYLGDEEDIRYFSNQRIQYHVLDDLESVEVVQSSEAMGNVIIPDSVPFNGKTYKVTSIGYKAFYNNTNVSTIWLPSTITLISDYAFYKCLNLKSLTIEAATPPSLDYDLFSDIFTGITASTILYVPEGCVDVYRADEVWGEFENILDHEPIPSAFDIPEPKASLVETGGSYYLYNVYAHGFLTNGEDYHTRACIGNRPLLAKLTQNTHGWRITFTSKFKSSTCEVLQNKDLFWDVTSEAVFCDMAGQGHNYWDIVECEAEEGLYNIRISPQDNYWAVSQERGDDLLVFTGAPLDDDDPWSYDWTIVDMAAEWDDMPWACWLFVSPADYECYSLRRSIYRLMQQVPNDGSEAYNRIAQIYLDKEADIESLLQIKQEAITLLCQRALIENPVDLTECIQGYDCSSPDGWKGVDWDHNSQPQKFVYNPNTYYSFEDETTISDFLECWVPVGSTLPNRSMYQSIIQLPKGRYRLEADVIATNQSGMATIHGASLYMCDGVVERMAACSTGNETPVHYVLDFVSLGDSIEIGFCTEGTNANWVAVDNFSLYYTGFTAKDELDYWLAIASTFVEDISSVGDGIFQYPNEAHERLCLNVGGAKIIRDSDANDENLKLTVSMLRGAIDAYKGSLQKPEAGKDYMIVQPKSGLTLSLETTSATLNVGKKVHFIDCGDNQWAITDASDESAQLCYGSSSTQALSTGLGSRWTIQPQGGRTYYIQGQYGFVGSGISSQAINSKCYGNRTSISANIQWVIGEPEEIQSPQPVQQWLALVLPFAASVPEDVTIYSCSDVDSNLREVKLVKRSSNVLNAMTPYILYGVQGPLAFEGINVADKDLYKTGLLTGSMIDQMLPDDAYTLQEREGLIGFYRGSTATSAYSVYMLSKKMTEDIYNLPSSITYIKSVIPLSQAADVFSLDGRCLGKNLTSSQIQALPKGLYIVNGRKMIVE